MYDGMGVVMKGIKMRHVFFISFEAIFEAIMDIWI